MKISEYDFSGQDYYCVGNKDECSHFEEDGAIVLPWKNNVILDENIVKLRLVPTVRQLLSARDKLPDSIRNMLKLECLNIPLSMLNNACEGDLPKSIKLLMLTGLAGSTYDSGINWGVIENLPCLEQLFFHRNFNADSYINQFSDFDINRFKNLKSIWFGLMDEGDLINGISESHSLENIHVEDVKKYPLFDIVPKHLKRLSIVGVDKNLEFKKIKQLRTIESIFVNGAQCEIDCEVLFEIKSLKSIYIVNSKKIINPEIFINKNNVSELRFINCGGAFKKIKKEFNPDDYNHLDIDFS